MNPSCFKVSEYLQFRRFTENATSSTAQHTMTNIHLNLTELKKTSNNWQKRINSKHVARCKYLSLTENIESDVLGNWFPHSIGGGALIHSGLVPVCLLNRNAGAFHGLLTRWQQVVLKQIRKCITSTARLDAYLGHMD
jgi:hypothetical protein